MKLFGDRKGQGTLEYVMMAALLAAVILFIYNKLKPAMEQGVDRVATSVGTVAR